MSPLKLLGIYNSVMKVYAGLKPLAKSLVDDLKDGVIEWGVLPLGYRLIDGQATYYWLVFETKLSEQNLHKYIESRSPLGCVVVIIRP